MPSSPEGAALTAQHRTLQLAVRADALRQFTGVWPALDFDAVDRSWPVLESALVDVVRTRRADSAGVAASYYQSFRAAEGVPGAARPVIAALNEEASIVGLRINGPYAAKHAMSLHRPNVRATTFSRLAGEIGRQVLNGGRETINKTVEKDRRALGFARVLGGKACAFCAMLASRGPVYKEDTVDFAAHANCACSSEPVFFDDTDWPPGSKDLRDLWDETTRGLSGKKAQQAFEEAYNQGGGASGLPPAPPPVPPSGGGDGGSIVPPDARIEVATYADATLDATAADAADVLDAIGELHGIPSSARPIPLQANDAMGDGHFGSFASYGIRGSVDGNPGYIEISTTAGARTQLTVAHEFGHYLDLDDLKSTGTWSTLSRSPELDEWFQAIEGSANVQHLRQLDADPLVGRDLRDYVRYLLSDKELWARSYSQWVANSLGDQRMLAAVDLGTADMIPGQWLADDFAPIGEAIQKAMSALGLLA